MAPCDILTTQALDICSLNENATRRLSYLCNLQGLYPPQHLFASAVKATNPKPFRPFAIQPRVVPRQHLLGMLLLKVSHLVFAPQVYLPHVHLPVLVVERPLSGFLNMSSSTGCVRLMRVIVQLSCQLHQIGQN